MNRLPPRFVFLRHGRTDWNRRGLVMGLLDIPLDDLGREQAKRAAAILDTVPVTSVWRSPLSRCAETATLATRGAALPTRVLPGLAERGWGVWEGRAATERPPRSETPEGGESASAFRERVAAAFAEIDDDELPLVVSHSGVYRVLMEFLRGDGEGASIPNALPVVVSPKAENRSPRREDPEP